MPGYQYKGTQRDTEAPAPGGRDTPRAPRPVPDRPTTLPVWEEPPTTNSRGRSSEKPRIVEVLKRKPGQWARVQDGMKSSGGAAAWKKLGCEAVTRKPEGSDRYAVWARWPEGGQ